VPKINNVLDFQSAKAKEFMKVLTSKPCLICGDKASLWRPFELINHATGKVSIIVVSICEECSKMADIESVLYRSTVNSIKDERIEWFGRL
jgi:hypothetical protein